ncbi:CDK5 [Cordylochernes scorpioides]|uniref:CDK5 n=1 Tax=Cordylochernes scorpioides TaxID=51811 RepID=A0ABY6KMW3_9ARAC|nr:CDK5 [Cordylochernes scorpioides]
MLKQSEGKYVVKCFEDFITEESKHIIVMEYCPLDLFSFLDYGIGKKITLEETRHIWWQIATGIKHLHDLGIIHRDVKPENILISSNGDCKLADFGFARELYNDKLLETVFGTVAYNAPEKLYGLSNYDYKVDTWSMGMTFANLYADDDIIKSTNSKEAIKVLERIFGKSKVRQAIDPNLPCSETTANLKVFKKIPRVARALVLELLECNRIKRLSAEQCLSHKFFSGQRNPPIRHIKKILELKEKSNQ